MNEYHNFVPNSEIWNVPGWHSHEWSMFLIFVAASMVLSKCPWTENRPQKNQMLGANPKDFLVGVDQFELLKTCTFLVKRITK